jgi:hypothetical protein
VKAFSSDSMRYVTFLAICMMFVASSCVRAAPLERLDIADVAQLRSALARPLLKTELVLAAGEYWLDSPVLLTHLKQVRIRGTVAGADKLTHVRIGGATPFGFELGDDIEALEISNLRITGDSRSRVTHAIGSHEGGRRIRGLRLSQLDISAVAVGISVGSCPTTSVTDVSITDNVIAQASGDDSGSGYGIHSACARRVEVARNRVRDTARHAIYLARGDRLWAHHNVISDHGSAQSARRARPYWRAALVVARSSKVLVERNVVERATDVSMSVERDESRAGLTSLNAKQVCLQHNTVIAQSADAPELWINVAPATVVRLVRATDARPIRIKLQAGKLAETYAPEPATMQPCKPPF